MDGLGIEDPGEVEMKVKAVNQQDMESEPASVMGYVDSQAPSLTGTQTIDSIANVE